jgi:branched-chain amino acid transport system ATP-binding protein
LRRDQPRPRADRIRDIYAQHPAIVAEGLSLVIVEQDIVQALKTARMSIACRRAASRCRRGEDTDAEKISAAYFGV